MNHIQAAVCLLRALCVSVVNSSSCRQERPQDIVSRVGQKTLRMKLHAKQRKLAMRDAHNLAVACRLLCPRCHLKFFRKRVRLNYKAVVTRCLKWVLKTGEQAAAVVV